METMEHDGGSKKTVASISPFLELCHLFEKITKCRIKQKRYKILGKYIADFRERWKTIHGNNSNSVDSFFPILRLMLPSWDRARGPYGVKEHTLARIYVRILCLPKEGSDASKLLNYRVPKFAGSMAGDFAEVAYWVFTSRCPLSPSNLSIKAVNNHLDNIAKHHADHEPRLIDKELTELLRVMSALEQKWLIRIILKGIRLGIGHAGILNAFHPDASNLFDVRSDLEKVCLILHDPSVKLLELEVEMFYHVRPMLATRTDPAKASLLLESPAKFQKSEHPTSSKQSMNYLVLETKLDGERFQLHMRNKEFKYFSHNGFDYTDTYGKDKSCFGTLTSRIAPLIYPSVESVILDGEMMVWDSKLHVFKTKGHCFDVKKLRASEVTNNDTVKNQRYQACFCVYDILFFNGQVLTGKPLIERINILKSIFRCQEGVIAHAPVNKKVTSKEQIVEALNEAIDGREEGIMLKEPFSMYKPNDRRGGWYKIKPEYIGEVSDTLDLLIIGGFYGGGRGKGIISHFLLGVACPPPIPGTHPKEFHSIGRVGSGYTFDELEELLNKIAPFWEEVKLGDESHERVGIKWTKERPDVWIHPHKSCILKIKATEITKCDAFKTGYTLRFPRVESVRYDKNWYDCMTTVEVSNLRQLGSGKLYTRHMQDDDVSPRKRPRVENRRGAVLGEQFKGADLTTVEKVSGILEGKEICVINGNEDHSKQDLEKLVAKYGGKIAQNPGPGTFCVIVGNEMPIRVRNMVRSGSHDVIHVSWLLKVCNPESPANVHADSRCPWKLDDIVGASAKTTEMLSLCYDIYGDSFTEPASISGLKKTIESMNTKESNAKLTCEEMEIFDIELFSGPSPFSIFRGCRGYFDHAVEDFKEEFADSSSLKFFVGISNFRFQSGTVVSKIDENTSHVIVESSISPSIPNLMKENHSREKKFYLVTLEWVKRSCAVKQHLNELDFHPNSPHLKELEESE